MSRNTSCMAWDAPNKQPIAVTGADCSKRLSLALLIINLLRIALV
jgi:hypothetical protein